VTRLARPALLILSGLSLIGLSVPAGANHGNADQASPNMIHHAQIDRGGTNSDLAFWNNLAAAGNYSGTRLLDVTKPENPVILSTITCRGPQGDVSFYEARNRLLLFVSVDTPQSVPGPPPGQKDCVSSDTTEAAGFEGIRIWDVTDPTAPKFIKIVQTDCGSHTHTTIPDDDNQRALIYVSSYPLAATGIGPNCGTPNETTGKPHGKISIVEVPDNEPEAADVLSEPALHLDTIPSGGEEGSLVGAVGCHDISVLSESTLGPEVKPAPRFEVAAAACLTEGQLWDISDPADPQTLDPLGHTHIRNESVEIWHSAAFTWDGDVTLFGDEHGGGAAPGCGGSEDPTGNIWFYRTVPPGSPEAPLLGRYALPRPQLDEDVCSLHNFNVIPLNDNKAYIGVSAAYNGGTSVFDFSPARTAQEFEGPEADAPILAEEIGFYEAEAAGSGEAGGNADTWSTYWYNDFIYANDIERGFEVFAFLRSPVPTCANADTCGGRQFRARKFHHENPQTQEVFQTVGRR
jgi:hypothetical protein